VITALTFARDGLETALAEALDAMRRPTGAD
jgi:hypothetical protein